MIAGNHVEVASMAENLELISTRVKPDFADQLREAAALDRRPLAQWVRNVLADAVAKSVVAAKSSAGEPCR